MRVAIQVVLALVIVGLSYFLYISITEPYAAIRLDQELTETTKKRMDRIRYTLIRYEQQNDRFPSTLDSVRLYARTDSFLVANSDSLYRGIPVDSLIYSPRTGEMFEYAVNDTSAVKIYRLKDPESNNQIGSLTPDVTRLNAASWE